MIHYTLCTIDLRQAHAHTHTKQKTKKKKQKQEKKNTEYSANRSPKI